jgi:hypothetical protein
VVLRLSARTVTPEEFDVSGVCRYGHLLHERRLFDVRHPGTHTHAAQPSRAAGSASDTGPLAGNFTRLARALLDALPWLPPE